MLRLRKVVPLEIKERTSVAQLSVELGMSAAHERFYSRVLGLDQIATADGIPLGELLLEVGDEALAGVDWSTVHYLIHTHTMQHVAPPAARLVGSLRDKLGLGAARAFSLAQQGCASGLYVLGIAEALLREEPAGSRALILIGDKASHTEGRLIPGATLLGDGAVGLLAALDGPGDLLLASSHRTLGEYHESRNMSKADQKRYQAGYVPMLREVMTEAVTRAGIALDEVAMVLPHNVNRFSWIETGRQLGFPVERMYLDNVARVGHCYGSDPFVNLVSARAEQRIAPGDHVLMVAAGQGATFHAAVVQLGPADHDHVAPEGTDDV